jgi:hypothetical protein
MLTNKSGVGALDGSDRPEIALPESEGSLLSDDPSCTTCLLTWSVDIPRITDLIHLLEIIGVRLHHMFPSQ